MNRHDLQVLVYVVLLQLLMAAVAFRITADLSRAVGGFAIGIMTYGVLVLLFRVKR